MRYLCQLIILTLLIFPISSWAVTLDELVTRDAIHFKKFSDLPYTGEVTGTYQGQFLDGKRHGKWLIYYESGQLVFEINYDRGTRDGLYRQFFTNGILAIKGLYKNGEWVGEWTEYYLSGQAESKGHYLNSLEVGLWKYWNPDGTLREMGSFNKNGKKDGVWIGYNKDGSVGRKIYYSNGNIIRREYF